MGRRQEADGRRQKLIEGRRQRVGADSEYFFLTFPSQLEREKSLKPIWSHLSLLPPAPCLKEPSFPPALCLLPSASRSRLSLLPSASCPLPQGAVFPSCPLPPALCLLPSASCPLPSALCLIIFTQTDPRRP